MNKKVFWSAFAFFLLMLAIGLVITIVKEGPEENKLETDCLMGCIAGLNYNGSEIVEIDIKKITQEDLNVWVKCEEFCEVYKTQNE